MASVLCLRPEVDFTRVSAPAPASLSVTYLKPDDAALAQRMKEAQALVIPAVGGKLAPVLFEGTSLKLVQVTGAGLDRLDRAGMTRLGIPVANVQGNEAVAEYAVTAATILLRRIAWADAEIKAGRYAALRARMLSDNLTGLGGLTVGVVGLGVIGLAVAQAFHAQGCDILYHDPATPNAAAAAKLGAIGVSLDGVLKTADVVTLHVPLIAATTSLIGVRELSLMKPTAVLIQASRGGVVDEQALVDVLAAERIAGAAVDVYSTEPPAADNPLLTLSGEGAHRLILTPHIAGVTLQSSAALYRAAWDNVERVLLRGEPPLCRAY